MPYRLFKAGKISGLKLCIYTKLIIGLGKVKRLGIFKVASSTITDLLCFSICLVKQSTLFIQTKRRLHLLVPHCPKLYCREGLRLGSSMFNGHPINQQIF